MLQYVKFKKKFVSKSHFRYHWILIQPAKYLILVESYNELYEVTELLHNMTSLFIVCIW